MDNSEAPVVMWSTYKRVDGFEVSVTLRGTTVIDVAVALDATIKSIIKAGGTPVSRQPQKYPPKVTEYIEGRVCPKDGGRLIKPPLNSNRPTKCENSKYDFQTKTSSGCDYISWENTKSDFQKDMEEK